jgi:hypothetical protein
MQVLIYFFQNEMFTLSNAIYGLFSYRDNMMLIFFAVRLANVNK